MTLSDTAKEEEVDEDSEIITFYESDWDDFDMNEDWVNGIH